MSGGTAARARSPAPDGSAGSGAAGQGTSEGGPVGEEGQPVPLVAPRGAGGGRPLPAGRVVPLREPVARTQSRHGRRVAVQVGQVPQPYVEVGGGDGHGRAVDGDHGAGRARGGAVGDLRLPYGEQALVQGEEREAERVAVRSEVGGAHQGAEVGGGPAPGEQAAVGRPVVESVVGAQGEVLRGAGLGARGQFLHEFAEAGRRGLVAGEVEGVRGVLGADRHCPLLEHVARVGLALHDVPGDAVLGGAFQDGPAGGVQAGVPGQRRVVEVDGHPLGQCEDLLGQHPQVGDAEQVGEPQRTQPLREAPARIDDAQPVPGGPAAQPRVLGDHGGHVVAPRQQVLAAFGQQGLLADQDGAEGCGHRCSSWSSRTLLSWRSRRSTSASERLSTICSMPGSGPAAVSVPPGCGPAPVPRRGSGAGCGAGVFPVPRVAR